MSTAPTTESALPAQARAKTPTKTPNDREGFRQAMSWLHTWAGLVLGWLLFAIFLTGTLSFFRNELNLWTHPELHGLPTIAAGTETNTAEKALAALHRKVPDVTQWIMHLPDERDPAVNVLWRGSGNGRFETLRMNPQTGEPVDIRQSMGGDFFYRFHFELRTAQKGRWTLEGRWVVGVATLLMFMALLTGVVTHRRIFKDFFTFRPGKGGQRAWLDAHNVSGVLVLPAVIANAGGVTVSYYEWVQDFSSFFWSEDEINARLVRIMQEAFAAVWQVAKENQVSLRTATFIVACKRILHAREARGLYP